MDPGILATIIVGALCAVLSAWVLFRPQNKTVVRVAIATALVLALICGVWLWVFAGLANGGL